MTEQPAETHEGVGVYGHNETHKGRRENCSGPNCGPQVDFLTVPLRDGGTRVRLDRLTDGRIMCQLCFEYKTREELHPVEGGVEDVCKPCAAAEAQQLAAMDRAQESRS